MNKICETCDTRLRLGLCNGKDHSCKYCFRKAGGSYKLEETILPFNDFEELKILPYAKDFDYSDLEIQDYSGEHLKILIGRWDYPSEKEKKYPLGYIIC